MQLSGPARRELLEGTRRHRRRSIRWSWKRTTSSSVIVLRVADMWGNTHLYRPDDEDCEDGTDEVEDVEELSLLHLRPEHVSKIRKQKLSLHQLSFLLVSTLLISLIYFSRNTVPTRRRTPHSFNSASPISRCHSRPFSSWIPKGMWSYLRHLGHSWRQWTWTVSEDTMRCWCSQYRDNSVTSWSLTTESYYSLLVYGKVPRRRAVWSQLP